MPTVQPPSRDTTVDAAVFWFRHKTELLVALLVLVLGGAGYAGYQVYVSRRDDSAAAFLAKAKTNQEYREVIDRYPETPAGASAYLFLAETFRAKKDFQQANATLQTFLDKFPEHELAGTARLAMAANFESMKKPDEALSTLQRLVANNPKSFIAPLALLSQVHLLKAKGKTDEARRVCESIMTQYRESYLSGEATRELRLLKPAATPTPVPAVSVAPQPAAAPSVSASPTSGLPPNPAPKKP